MEDDLRIEGRNKRMVEKREVMEGKRKDRRKKKGYNRKDKGKGC